ncbi:hypothetical protein F0231_20660 [Vibrio sp. RE86]|uniref:LPO_1073/Vpar_1526 family protein n=1 Tax=Vibrio sp. RE86 TaxID=2607605 RepID=UPI00149354DB|nr:LPO_1073/Vpar_1526 family protein [Vibrio sp. RE86]NOH82130.1 hypothetical protein [Vibrio sp. RE86]
MTQKLVAKNDAQAFQAGRDLNQYVGLSQSECERLFQLLFLENMPKMEAIAQAEAQRNVDSLIQTTYKKIAERLDKIESERMAQPDFQATANEAVIGVSRKGSEENIEILSNLIVQRLNRNNDDFLDLTIELATSVVAKLTKNQVNFVVLKYFLNDLALLGTGVTFSLIEKFSEKVYLNFYNPEVNLSELNIRHLASLGLLEYNFMYGHDIFDSSYQNKYGHLAPDFEIFKNLLESNCPKYHELLDYYSNSRLKKVNLSNIGIVVAIGALLKFYPELESTTWLKET